MMLSMWKLRPDLAQVRFNQEGLAGGGSSGPFTAPLSDDTFSSTFSGALSPELDIAAIGGFGACKRFL